MLVEEHRQHEPGRHPQEHEEPRGARGVVVRESDPLIDHKEQAQGQLDHHPKEAAPGGALVTEIAGFHAEVPGPMMRALTQRSGRSRNPRPGPALSPAFPRPWPPPTRGAVLSPDPLTESTGAKNRRPGAGRSSSCRHSSTRGPV